MTRFLRGIPQPVTIRPFGRVPSVAIAAAFLLLYVGGAWWGSELGDGGATTPWYPPPGLAVTLVVAFGLRFSPLVAIAEAIASIVVFDVAEDFSTAQIVVNAVLIASAYSVGPAVLRRFAGNGPALRHPGSAWLFMGTCVLMGPALAATGGIGIREWADATGGEPYWDSVQTWFVGDALGVITVAPIGLILLLERVRFGRLVRRANVLQAAVLLATGAATILLEGDGTPGFVYLCLIPLAWIAQQHGLVGASAAVATLNVEVVALADATLTTRQLEELQGLAGVIALSGLVLGSLSSENRQARRRIAAAATRDPLTGLASRSQLLSWMSEELTGPSGAPALVMVDIDRFSLVNDVRGHSVGDRLLRLIAERIAEVIRYDGRCARFGSDEFAVLLASPERDAEQMAGRLVEAIGRPFEVDGEDISIHAHAGIAVPREGERPGDVIRGACLALQRAADDKRKVVVLDAALREQNHHSHVLESDLGDAIGKAELSVLYQPITWMGDPGHEAYEALLRWNHPVYGGVPPPVIIELAQRSGVLGRVTEFVLEQACRQVAHWQAQERLVNVGVNIVAADLMLSNFSERATEIVEAAGIEPSHITFELTEETAIQDLQQAETVMRRLRERGFRLAIDDFGTGYSSLTYLERLPVDVIKLDRTFVARLTGDSPSDAILKAIVPLAHALGFRVLGEGVETEHQLDLLSDLRCDAIQGFLLGTPREADECVPLARAV